MIKTAIILFAHLPDFEARAKSLSGFSSQKSTQRISSILTQHFYQLSQQTSAETFLIDSFHQKGKTFGERITNAFVSIYAKGYENVICIGNDCPELNLQQLQNSIVEIEKGNVVLGPTVDGGAYLIGIPKNHFNKEAFLKIKWQTRKTYKDILKSYQVAEANIIENKLLADIDKANDVYTHHHQLIYVLLNEIRNFILAFNTKNKTSLVPTSICQDLFFRGPPAFII
ncbi:MAG: DUF2064 domain-containing protein [Pelobium sp.]